MIRPRATPARVSLVGAIVYLIGFHVWFFAIPLYNSAPDANSRMRRIDVLAQALGPSSAFQPNLFADAGRRLFKVENLVQRIPATATALAILVATFLLGDLLCPRLLGKPCDAILDRVTLGVGLGAGVVALLVQGLGLVGQANRGAVLAVAAATLAGWLLQNGVGRRRSNILQLSLDNRREGPSRGFAIALGVGMALFAGLSLLSANLPTPDYDAHQYHLLGPKEYWLAGKITFLTHNVYTAFPFLCEMLVYLAMIVRGDWQTGGLTGQVVLWAFAPLGAIAVGRLTSRLAGAQAGWLAAFAYLSTPWVYRLGSIPYVEGPLLFFGVLAVDCALRAEWLDSPFGWRFLAGAFAGCAVGCKYPGLLMVGVPAGAIVASAGPWKFTAKRLFPFCLGLGLLAGPWLIRNALWTGNPVFPLAYKTLGGRTWSKEKDDRFVRGHQARDFSWSALRQSASEVVGYSDWQSGLMFALAPFGFALALRSSVHPMSRRAILQIVGVIGWQFAIYWWLTHRLDRFWLPMLPFLACLAGAGMTWAPSCSRWRLMTIFSIALNGVYNFAYCTDWKCGMNAYTADLPAVWQNSERMWPAVQVANDRQHVPEGAAVLFVGFSAPYLAKNPTLYNTVFDDNRLEILTLGENGQLLDQPTIIDNCSRMKVRFLFVDWSWVDQYRSPGNYGYSPHITPDLFARLVERGVLTRRLQRGDVELFEVKGLAP